MSYQLVTSTSMVPAFAVFGGTHSSRVLIHERFFPLQRPDALDRAELQQPERIHDIVEGRPTNVPTEGEDPSKAHPEHLIDVKNV